MDFTLPIAIGMLFVLIVGLPASLSMLALKDYDNARKMPKRTEAAIRYAR